MKIKNVELENFRCYHKKKIDFTDNSGCVQMFNVLIGNNGVGKTAILEGIAKGFIPVLRTVNRKVAIGEDFKDITYYDMTHDCNWTKIGITCEHNNEMYSWHNYKRKNSSEDVGKIEPQREIKLTLESNQYSNNEEYPLVIYYSVNRLFEVPQRMSSGRNAFYPLDGALTSKNEFRRFYNWFKAESYLAATSREYSSKKLDAVKLAIDSLLINYKNLETKLSPSRMVLMGNDGVEYKIENLSGGYKAVFSLVSDIASRLALAYPNFENPLIGSAIVLIDELDLHLHPKWQKRIVEDLKRTFPNCQFIITTHSPFIIQSLSKSELINLESKNIESLSGSYGGYTIEEIENIMGVDPGTVKFIELINKYNDALIGNRKDIAIEVVSEIEGMVNAGNNLIKLMKLDLITVGMKND